MFLISWTCPSSSPSKDLYIPQGCKIFLYPSFSSFLFSSLPLFYSLTLLFYFFDRRTSLLSSSTLPFTLSCHHLLLPQNNPRMASVVASVPSICLSLSKTVFRNALSEDSFAAVLSTVLAQRKKARKRRQAASKNRLVAGTFPRLLALISLIFYCSCTGCNRPDFALLLSCYAMNMTVTLYLTREPSPTNSHKSITSLYK